VLRFAIALVSNVSDRSSRYAKSAWLRVIFSLVAFVRCRYIANVNGARQALAIRMSAKQKPSQTIYVGVASLGTSVCPVRTAARPGPHSPGNRATQSYMPVWPVCFHLRFANTWQIKAG
jgi:hypothetical protein